MPTAASVRELKNQTTKLLRKVEKGTLVIVTRRGKPVATLKPFEEQDLHQDVHSFPTRRSSDLKNIQKRAIGLEVRVARKETVDHKKVAIE